VYTRPATVNVWAVMKERVIRCVLLASIHRRSWV
jgi:hypothetical protein